MGDFKGVSERFNVNLVSEEGYGSERIRCEIGLDGLVIASPDGGRTLRKYPLNHISRWSPQGSSLVLYTKTPVDVEEHTLVLQSDSRTIQNLLDTLTCSCMQMMELMQSKEHSKANKDITNSLSTLLNGGGASKSQLPTVDQVEFWRDPEKAGWMHCQGEIIKSWRRRWFVLKQGFLFRFADPDVKAASKPRGVVDLSKVTNVSDARELTGRPNSLKLSTETGHVAYVCDGETEMVEWFSALEQAVTAIVKKVAGVEDEPPPAERARPSAAPSSWTRQLEQSYSSAGGGGGGGRASGGGSSLRSGNPMVKIVGYDAPAPQQHPQRHGLGGGHPARSNSYGQAQAPHSDYGGGADRLSYSNISGVAGVAGEGSQQRPGSTFSDSFSGGGQQYPAYPVLAPSRSSGAQEPGGGYGAYSQSGSGSYGQPGDGGGYGQRPQQQQGQAGAPAYGQAQPAYQQQSYGGGASGYQTQAPQAPQGGGGWQVHYTPEGRPYYHNAATGSTQWEPPANMS